MPVFEVVVEEVHDQTQEEIWRSYRNVYRQRYYEVEAENENEAITIAEEGGGTFLRSEEEYGDTIDSDFYEDGEVIGEDYVETNVMVVPPTPQRISATTSFAFPTSRGPILFAGSGLTNQREPDWEV